MEVNVLLVYHWHHRRRRHRPLTQKYQESIKLPQMQKCICIRHQSYTTKIILSLALLPINTFPIVTFCRGAPNGEWPPIATHNGDTYQCIGEKMKNYTLYKLNEVLINAFATYSRTHSPSLTLLQPLVQWAQSHRQKTRLYSWTMCSIKKTYIPDI